MVDATPPAPSSAPVSPPVGARHLNTVPFRPRKHPGPNTGSSVGSELLDQIRSQDRELRQWHLRVRAWAITEGAAVDRDGLTAVLAILLEAQRNGGPHVTSWTAARVGEMAWSASTGWAARLGVPLPAGTASALTRFWAYLAAQHAFATGSDPLQVLVAALETHTDPARRRSGRKHPSIGKQIVRV